MKQYRRSLFIFRRDLRLVDNRGLNRALAQSEQVIPCFILDPRQVGEANRYRSSRAVQFMLESLQDLDHELELADGHLFVFEGKAPEVVQRLLTKFSVDAVFVNEDYSPFSRERDGEIKRMCEQNACTFHSFHDELLLGDPGELVTGSGKPYQKFTPFFAKARVLAVEEPERLTRGSQWQWFAKKIPEDTGHSYLSQKVVPDGLTAVRGGRAHSAQIIRNLGMFSGYAKTHDVPADPTTMLSAYLKFGTHSIREVYHAMVEKLGKQHPLIRQLYWRDFFTYTLFHKPLVLGHACNPRFESVNWTHNKKLFARWCSGETGFPIVDAGMRQLNQTGWMHNRVRMIVASFLTKDLHIDWRWGEQYFAQQLVDYDVALNNGNWQWVASTGCDAQPYFRIFNPWLQQKKFDPDAIYCKRWIPELRDVQPRIIRSLFRGSARIDGYPEPMVDHEQEKNIALRSYKRA